MKTNRTVVEPFFLENMAENKSLTEIIIVSGTRLESMGRHHRHHHGESNVWTPGAVLPLDQHKRSPQPAPTILPIFINTGVVGCLLLVLLGCLVYQYCKNRLKHSCRCQQHSEAGKTVPARQTDGASPDRTEDAASDTRQDPGSGAECGVSYSELSQLTGKVGPGQPVRYCFIGTTHRMQVSPDSNVVLATDTAGQGAACSNATRPCMKRKSVPYGGKSLTIAGKPLSETAGRTTFPRVATENPDAVDSAGYAEGEERGEKTLEGGVRFQCNKLSPNGDATSDVSDYLVTLGLDDISWERGDVTEGERNGQTDDSVQSSESFSRLHYVKAQADFSPYHLAWSTPHVPHAPPSCSTAPRPPRLSSTAKKLNMDAQPHGRPTRQDAGPCSEDSANGEAPTRRGWGHLKPEDARGRPASTQYRTPRPSLRGRQRGGLGPAPGVDAEAKESPQPLAYTVAEYRKSLRDISSAATPAVKAAVAGSPSGDPRGKSQASHVCCASLQNQGPVSKTPCMSTGPEHVPRPREVLSSHQLEDPFSPDSTLAVSRDPSDPVAPGTQERRLPTVIVSVLDDNGHFEDSADMSRQSREESSTDTSSPQPCADSLDTDGLSSDVTPSSESMMVNTADDSSPEASSPSTSGSQLSKRDETPGTLPKLNRPSSSTHTNPQDLDNFKVPFPVGSVKPRLSVEANSQTSLPRSKSSTHKPLNQHCLPQAATPQMRRSRTSESISSSWRSQQQLMSVGSLTDVSVAGSSASRTSLAWDHEFTASGYSRGINDSLAWEDDPYLN